MTESHTQSCWLFLVPYIPIKPDTQIKALDLNPSDEVVYKTNEVNFSKLRQLSNVR